MIKQTLAPDMLLYTFPEQALYISILALLYDDRAFLIDTGVTEQAVVVKQDLQAQGIAVQHIFNNHYNLDHIVGNHVFAGVEFLGSEHYTFHLERSMNYKPEHQWVAPTLLLKGGERMSFGPFRLEFMHLPGHTDCSMILRINSDTIHAADNIIRLLDGTDLVPFHMHPDAKVPEFIATLETIQRLASKRLILSHAVVIEGADEVHKAIESRLYYMRKLQKLGAQARLEDCLDKGIPVSPTSIQWHEKNLQRLSG